MNGNAQKATEGQKLEVIAAIVKASPRILRSIVRNLTHETAKKWIGDQKGLEKVLIEAGRNVLMVTQCKFPIWKTIRLGTGLKTDDDFCKSLKSCGHRIGGWGNRILGSPEFTVATKETEIDLVVVSNADLGFKGGACLKDTYERALEFGLILCPNEVGPQLRRQHIDQPMGERLLIAMDPIEDSACVFSVFLVALDGFGSWLEGSNGYPIHRRRADDRFVFALPRK